MMKRHVDWHHIDPGKPVENVFIESWRHQDLLLCGSDLRGGMKRFIEGTDRGQSTLLPECLDDWNDDDNLIRVIDAFVEALNLAELGFAGVEPETTGRPSYHPSVLLKLYIYGYLNRVQSSRRLEREAGRNFEVMWLPGRLVPDHKTVADFRKDNGPAHPQGVRALCRALPRDGSLWGHPSYAYFPSTNGSLFGAAWQSALTGNPIL